MSTVRGTTQTRDFFGRIILSDKSYRSDKLVTVHTVNDQLQAEIIRNGLDANGIPCELDGSHQAGLTGIIKIGLLVPSSFAKQAKEFIRSHELHDNSAD